MSGIWLTTLLLYSLCCEVPANGLAWLLLIPFAAQDVYDANRRRK